MNRVKGIGGVFFRAAHPQMLNSLDAMLAQLRAAETTVDEHREALSHLTASPWAP